MTNLRSRLDRIEKRLPKDDVKIVVTKSDGHCPASEEKAESTRLQA